VTTTSPAPARLTPPRLCARAPPLSQEHTEVNRLEFLPYHFLLASVGAAGVLRYQDTSTGQVVAQHRTRLGPCDAMRQNPWNAVLCLGHANGTVTMWTPNLTTPAVKMLAHHGPVRSLAVDAPGRHLVTTGADGSVKVWDVRTYRELHAYTSAAPAEWCDISQRGLLAVGHGRRVQVWRGALAAKAPAPYLNHTLAGGALRDFAFCPYEDVLAVGHSGGVSTMLVPGAGEPNYDSYVADPFQGGRQRREAEVHQLLDKLQPDMITLDPGAVGRVEREPAAVQRERQAEAQAANAARLKETREAADQRSRMKGKNRPSRRRGKKQQNVIEERKPRVKAAMRAEGVSAEFGHKRAAATAAAAAAAADGVPRALRRFHTK
jgi:U3 small nucleolar RNA-associated protein 7